MRNILGVIIQSLKEKWGEIIVGVTLLIVLLLTLSLYNFSFDEIEDESGENKKEKTTDTIEFVYEGMRGKYNKLCEIQDDLEKEKMCGNLGNGGRLSCNNVECCVWATNKNGGSCVGGDNLGPSTKQDSNKMKYDEYYYLNKKYKVED